MADASVGTPCRRGRRTRIFGSLILILSGAVAGASPPLLVLDPGGGAALDDSSRQSVGASGMLEPHTGSLLVDYYETFLRDRDLGEFRDRVLARYTEETLCRVLASSPHANARRGAVLALGVMGTLRRLQRHARPGDARRRLRGPHHGRTRPLGRLVPGRHPREQPDARRRPPAGRDRPRRRGRRAGHQADRPRPQVRRGLQPAGHRLLQARPVRRERRGLPARSWPSTPTISGRWAGSRSARSSSTSRARPSRRSAGR